MTADNTATGVGEVGSPVEGAGGPTENMPRDSKTGLVGGIRATWLRRVVLVVVFALGGPGIAVWSLGAAVLAGLKSFADEFAYELESRLGKRQRLVAAFVFVWGWDSEFITDPDGSLARARKRVIG